jgi:hypothetical protein
MSSVVKLGFFAFYGQNFAIRSLELRYMYTVIRKNVYAYTLLSEQNELLSRIPLQPH